MPADNAAHLVTAARRRHELTRSKAIQALRELEHAGNPVTFQTVAHRAGVSRSWLYTQPDLRSEIQRLRQATRQAPRELGPHIPESIRRLTAAPPGSREPTQPLTHRREPATPPPTRPRARRPTRHPSARTAAVRTSHFDNDRTVLTRRPAPSTTSSRTLSTTRTRRSQPRSEARLKITIESINARIRRAVNARGHFPNEQAALKCVYLAIMSLDPTSKGRKRWTNRWKAALNAFEITFDGRLSAGRK